MITSKEHNKNLALKTKKALEELGHKVTLGHCYELISKQAGYPNWDTACAEDICLLQMPKKEKPTEIAEFIFNFTPRSAKQLQKDIEKIIFEFLAEDKEPRPKTHAKAVVKCLQNNIEDTDFFLLFDALGCYNKDLELDHIYSMASQCWHNREVPGHNPDLELETLLKHTITYGFDKVMHFNFCKKRKQENEKKLVSY